MTRSNSPNKKNRQACDGENDEKLFRVIYRKVASFKTSCLEAHAEFFMLVMKGIFNPYVL